MFNLKDILNKLFYRRLYEKPSSERIRDEIDCLETCLSDYDPVENRRFFVELGNGKVKYFLNNNALVRLVVEGNFSLVIVEAEKNHRKLFQKLREFYTEVRFKSLE